MAVWGGICFLQVLAPLAFGSVHVWAYSLVNAGVFTLLSLWVIDRLVLRKSEVLEWAKTPVNPLMIAALVLIGVQLVPLPAEWVRLLSPQTYLDKIQLSEVMAQSVNTPSASGAWMSLAYYRHPVMAEGLKVAAYFGVFFLVMNAANSKRRIDALVTILILVGLFEVLYGIYQVFTETPRVWWWKSRVGSSNYASGTFIVSNHFAFYMEMSLSLTAGFVIAQKRRTGQMESGLKTLRASLQRIVGGLSPASARPKTIMLTFIAVLMGVALLMSASRGGILAIGVAAFLGSIILLTRRRLRRFGALALLVCVFTVMYGLHLGIDPTLEKFEKTGSLARRLYTTRSMFPMVGDFPVTGVGWGNFRYLYPRYVPADHDGVSSSGYSHNDWVEALTETGAIGGVLLLALGTAYLARLFRVWRRRRDYHALGIGIGVMMALFSAAFHSYFDFSMHIPANPLMLAALLGIGYASVHRQGRGPSESFFYNTRQVRLTTCRRAIGTCLILLLAGTGTALVGRHFLAEGCIPTEWNSTMNLDWEPNRPGVDRAIALNPLNAEYYWRRAALLKNIRWAAVEEEKTRERRKPTSDRLGDRMQAIPQALLKASSEEEFREIKHEMIIEDLEKSVCLNPARGAYWYELGLYYHFRSYDPYNYIMKWLPLAEDCFDIGLGNAPGDADMLFRVGWYWVWRASLLPMSGERHLGIRRFQEYFQRSLSLRPGNWKRAVDRVWEYHPDDAVVLGVVPDGDDNMKRRALKYLAGR